MGEPGAGGLPQPLRVTIESPQPDESGLRATAREANKHLRDTARWIVGGIVATAGAVMAGSSLTNLGTLDPVDDRGRLVIAIAGGALGFLSLGFLMAKALGVFQVRSTDLERLAQAGAKTEWGRLRKEVETEFGLPQEGPGSLAERLQRDEDDLLTDIEAALPYLYVRLKFDDLVWWLPITVATAAIGFGVFAWAANPPEKKAPADSQGIPSISINIGEPLPDS